MLAMIGDFEFKVDGTSFDEFKNKITYGFVEHENIGGFNTYQSIGKHEQADELKGVLFCKSQKQLKGFENLAAKKEVQIIAFSNGDAYNILIFTIEKTKSNFTRDGKYLKQDYLIQLKRVGEQ